METETTIEETTAETAFCHYEVCRDGTMELCGEPAIAKGPDLCAEHFSFVKDCTVGPFTRSKKAHPAGYDWLGKARAAYGVARPSMKPSDAGKAPAPYDPADIADWNTRAVRYSWPQGEQMKEIRTPEIIEARYQQIIATEGAPAGNHEQAAEQAVRPVRALISHMIWESTSTHTGYRMAA